MCMNQEKGEMHIHHLFLATTFTASLWEDLVWTDSTLLTGALQSENSLVLVVWGCGQFWMLFWLAQDIQDQPMALHTSTNIYYQYGVDVDFCVAVNQNSTKEA